MEKWETAYSDYKKGLKYKEIAEKHGVSLNTVKSWAVRYWKKLDKDNENEVATNMGEKLQPKRKPGAPKGNQNAVGNDGGPPEGKQNNYKHGLYEKVSYSNLSLEEQMILNNETIDEEQELIRTIRFSDIQVNRFLEKINKEEMSKGLVLSGVSKTVSKNEEGKDICNSTTTITTAAHDLIIRYYNEIGKITAKKIRCLEALSKIGLEKQRLKMLKEKIDRDSGGNGNIDALVSSIEKAREQGGE